MTQQTAQDTPAAHEFIVKPFEDSRAQHAGCTGCTWIGPFVYDRTTEEREHLATVFAHKHRTT